MPDSIGEALKIFLEKHLVPTVISVVAAIVALLVLPTDYWMIEKIGKTLFFFLVAGVVFLAIQVLVLLWKGIQHLKHRAYISKEYKEIVTQIGIKLDRGATYLHGEGSYSGEDTKVVLVAIKKQQLAELKELVMELDPAAFVIVQEAHQVLGDGFHRYSRHSL